MSATPAPVVRAQDAEFLDVAGAAAVLLNMTLMPSYYDTLATSAGLAWQAAPRSVTLILEYLLRTYRGKAGGGQ